MYKQKYNTPKETQRKRNGRNRTQTFGRSAANIGRRAQKMDPAELEALEEEIAQESFQKLIKLVEEPAEEKSFAETYWEHLLKGIDKSQYKSNVKELQRIKKIRKETNCDGVKCMLKPGSGINHDARRYWCEHLEALMQSLAN